MKDRKRLENIKNAKKTAEVDEFNSISAYDCTGLIPTAVKDEFEAESYEEVYHYLPPEEDGNNE